MNSKFEISKRELHAKLLSGERRSSWPSKSRMQFKNTSDVTLQTDTNQHDTGGELHAKLRNDGHLPANHAPPAWRASEDRRRGRGAGGRRQGLAGQRVDAPSEARGADDSRAGRRPPAHTAARPIKAGHAAAGNLAGQRAPPEIRRCHKPPSNGEASELLVVLRVLVGLAAVGSPERANRSHLFRRQREREDVEVLALALGVTGLGQGQSTELVVPA